MERVTRVLRWPLKRQIRVLGVLVVVTGLASLALAVGLVRQSESARVADAASHLARAASQIAIRYDYLRPSFEAQHLATPLTAGSHALLRSLTDAALMNLPGVEGGFFRASDGRLLGYAYPTYRGSGPKTDIPAAEQPTIERVARRAVATGAPADEHVPAGSDVILFRATPLTEGARPAGTVWVMARVTGLGTPQFQLYRVGLIVTLLVSGALAATAWSLTRRLDRGVTRLESGLRTMEARLDAPVGATGIPELDRVATGIERLATAVQEHQRQRAALEARVHRTDRLAALGRLVGGVAHEVRNPLASIRLKLHLARRSAEDPQQLVSAFAVIQEEIERLDRLVERLLTLAKPAEAGRLPSHLGRLVQTRVDLWAGRAAEHAITLEVQDRSPQGTATLVDGDRVAQILDNLVANAMEALRDRGGRVTVTLERPSPAEVRIQVADTGPGVPPALVDRLFEPFFTTRPTGTGLGLFLAAELARGLGGEVRYEPQPGGGADFEVRLPC